MTYSSEWHALTSDLVGTNPTVTSEWPPVPDLDFLVTNQVPPFSQSIESTLISDQVGTNPSITLEWPYASHLIM